MGYMVEAFSPKPTAYVTGCMGGTDARRPVPHYHATETDQHFKSTSQSSQSATRSVLNQTLADFS